MRRALCGNSEKTRSARPLLPQRSARPSSLRMPARPLRRCVPCPHRRACSKQPGPLARPGAGQRGHRDPLAAVRGYPHHRGMDAAASDAALRRPQAPGRTRPRRRARCHSKNVKRWRDGTMALRWCAAGMLKPASSSAASTATCTSRPSAPRWRPPSLRMSLP